MSVFNALGVPEGYEYTVTGEATTTTDEDGNLVTVPGTTTRQTVQRQVMFTSEG